MNTTTLAKIQILTLLYQPRVFLPPFLESLAAVNYPADRLELHLLDNGNAAAVSSQIKQTIAEAELPFSVTLHRSDENLGFSGGNNLLFDKLLGDSSFSHCFLLNQDAKIDPQCFAELAAVWESNAAPRIGMIEARQAPKEHPKTYDPQTLETSWCSGGGVMITKSALREVGMFDHNFFLYCEDVDLSWRMWLADYSCLIAPKAVYEHFTEEQDQDKDQSVRYFYSFRNGFYMHLKYDSLPGVVGHYIKAWGAIFLQDPVRKKAYLKAYFCSFKKVPHYLLFRLQNKRPEYPKWICFSGFDYGERRKFRDTATERIFI